MLEPESDQAAISEAADLSAQLSTLGDTAPVPEQVTAESPTRYINRELSWLAFNERVLALVDREDVPLLERAKFLAIAVDNLDEFFQVRVAALKEQMHSGLSPVSAQGAPPEDQLREIRRRVEALYARADALFATALVPELANASIRFVEWAQLDAEARAYLTHIFEQRIFPVLTPLAVDPSHPFPYISNLSLNLAVVVHDHRTRDRRVARVKVPRSLPRYIVLPRGDQIVPLEQVIAAHLGSLFSGMEVIAHHAFRVTRSADFQLDWEEADDLLDAVRDILKRRRRSELAVRIEVLDTMPSDVVDLLVHELELDSSDVYTTHTTIDLSGLFGVYAFDRPELKFPKWSPLTQPRLASPPGEPPPNIFHALSEGGDIMVQHPYDSFESSVEEFIDQAADDPAVLAIKQTLYRTSGKESSLPSSLARAAESGKQVVALIELTARFDEQNNIRWAKVLEAAGVHVVYGMVGLKTHAKVALVVRDEGGEIRRYCHVSTGNYNPDTARLYEDIGILSADPELGADVGELFNTLTGYSEQQRYRRLLVAPVNLRSSLLALIEGQAGPDGRITIKVNSLVDPEIIDALYAASQAGAAVDLVVRGICCLRPGIPGLSDRIRARSIVGRYLEHSRVFRFGAPGERTTAYFISSADLRQRNLSRRVETAIAVNAPELQRRLDQILETMMQDDQLAWELRPDGTWRRAPTGAEPVETHTVLRLLAMDRNRGTG